MRVFFEKIEVLDALLWDLKFPRNWGKTWAPTNTTVGAYFSTVAQPFPIFRKLLAIIPSIQNHPHSRILNLKINTNTKSPMLLTQYFLYQGCMYCSIKLHSLSLLNSLWGKLGFRELFYKEFPNNFAHYSTVPVKCWIFLRIMTSLLLSL